MNLDRQAGAKSHCSICNRNHDKDNYLYLEMTATKIK